MRPSPTPGRRRQVLPYSRLLGGHFLRRPTSLTRSLLVGAALFGATLAAPNALGARFGVADDAGKYAEGSAAYFRQLRALGMTENRIGVMFDPQRPTTIVDKAFLDKALPSAQAQGVKVVFHVFALSPTAMTATTSAVADYTAFLERPAGTIPRSASTSSGTSPTSRASGNRSSTRADAAPPRPPTPTCLPARTTPSRASAARSASSGWALRPRERPPVRALERLLVAGPLPARPRRRLPGQQAHAPPMDELGVDIRIPARRSRLRPVGDICPRAGLVLTSRASSRPSGTCSQALCNNGGAGESQATDRRDRVAETVPRRRVPRTSGARQRP